MSTRPAPGAYRPFVSARRPGGKPSTTPSWRVLVHRQYAETWEQLAGRVGLVNAQQFWDHVASTPDRPPKVGTSSPMKGKYGRAHDGWSRRIHYEITGAGRIDYEYHAAYRANPDGDAHRVVRILSIDLGSH